MGRIESLLHDSQALQETEGTIEDLVEWMGLEPSVASARVLNALVECKLVKPAETEDRWIIVGNKKHIKTVSALKRRSAELNAKRWGYTTDDLEDDPSRTPTRIPSRTPIVDSNTDDASSDPSRSPSRNQALTPTLYNAVSAVPCSEVNTPAADEPPPVDEKALLKLDSQECLARWQILLRHFKIVRGPIRDEDITISRYVKLKGKEAVLLAFLGAEVEPKVKDFDPANYVSLSRIFGEQFESMVNRGSAESEKRKLEAERKEREAAELEAFRASRSGIVENEPEHIRLTRLDLEARLREKELERHPQVQATKIQLLAEVEPQAPTPEELAELDARFGEKEGA